MVKKYPYVTVFERTRVLGNVIAPTGLTFRTELEPTEMSEELILHISCQVLNVPHVAYIAQKTMAPRTAAARITGISETSISRSRSPRSR